MEKHRNLSLDSREYRTIGRNITSSVNRDSFTPLTLTLIVTPTRHIYTYIYIFYTYIHISIFIHTIIHIHFHLIFSFNNLINLRPAKANKFTHNISLQRHCSRIVFVERRIALSAGIKNDESLFFNHRT